MSAHPPPIAPQGVPTLTEVVEWPAPGLAVGGVTREASNAPGPAMEVPAGAITEDQLVQRVLGDVLRQVDLMLDVRLRESLSLILARTTDSLVRDARKDMAATLRDIVTRAVSQELARRRDR